MLLLSRHLEITHVLWLNVSLDYTDCAGVFDGVREHGSCHEQARLMQAFHAIKLPSLGTP
jgi:hypothetical protein